MRLELQKQQMMQLENCVKCEIEDKKSGCSIYHPLNNVCGYYPVITNDLRKFYNNNTSLTYNIDVLKSLTLKVGYSPWSIQK